MCVNEELQLININREIIEFAMQLKGCTSEKALKVVELLNATIDTINED